MSMVTSCPACTTTFRVSPEQLKQRQGKVRCGKCRGVFDAFKSLATLPDETPESTTDPSMSGAAMHFSTAGSGAGIAGPGIGIAGSGIGIAGSGIGAVAPGMAAVGFGTPQQGLLDIGASEPGLDAGLAHDRPPSAGRSRPLWLAALAVLALLLAAQLAYAFRDRLAAAWPASRSLLERMCAPVGCTVAWPQRPDLLAIEASDLKADPARPSVIVLTATVRNRGSIGVAPPALELTLTDAQDQTVARRIFLPRDYLPAAMDANNAMPALAEVDVRVTLDTGALRPAGYRLFLFYP